MEIGDLVRRRNNGDLAIVIETDWSVSPPYLKVNVLTLKGHKQYWYPVECEVISGNR